MPDPERTKLAEEPLNELVNAIMGAAVAIQTAHNQSGGNAISETETANVYKKVADVRRKSRALDHFILKGIDKE